jgi:hypothetical protein
MTRLIARRLQTNPHTAARTLETEPTQLFDFSILVVSSDAALQQP